MHEKIVGKSSGRTRETAQAAISMKERELVMKVTKEIVVKFAEMGKVTPASFREVFSMVHGTVKDAMDGNP